MKMSDERYEEIKHAVADMFVDYDIKGIPINAFEVALKIGITIIPYSAMNGMKKVAGITLQSYSEDGFSVETHAGTWVIYYNDADKNFTRINQTIMHEVGHYILGHIEEGEIEESEAKFFAKYALAPPPLIHNMTDKKTVDNIMKTFDIGYQAACIALDNYEKWLVYGSLDYQVYERKILFQVNLEEENDGKEGHLIAYKKMNIRKTL